MEVHHQHLTFTHHAIGKKFNPPGQHPVFKRIMERASQHCTRARLSTYHCEIKNTERMIRDTRCQLAELVDIKTFVSLSDFLKKGINQYKTSLRTLYETGKFEEGS